jgi:tetratricopeptide (TPR) repeat protein
MKNKKPWSLLTLSVITLIFGFIPGLFLYGQNWIRLGETKKSMIPMALSIICLVWMPLLYINQTIPYPFIVFMGMNILSIILFIITQKKSLTNQTYASPWTYPIVIGVIATIATASIYFIQTTSQQAHQQAQEYQKAEQLVYEKRYSEALPLLVTYYERFKPYGLMDEHKYRNLILALQGTGQEQKAIMIINEALTAYPNNVIFMGMKNALEK